jgi:hypothetical protein
VLPTQPARLWIPNIIIVGDLHSIVFLLPSAPQYFLLIGIVLALHKRIAYHKQQATFDFGDLREMLEDTQGHKF